MSHITPAPGTFVSQPTVGLLSAQPTASTFGKGFYWASDDNGGTLYYSNATTWTKQAPGVNQAATPSLVAGPAKVTANFTTTSTSDVDVTGLSVTFTAVASATYWIRFKGQVGNTVSAAIAHPKLTDGSNTQLDAADYTAKAANDSYVMVLEGFVTPAAGSVTYKVRLSAGSSTAFIAAGSTFPAQLAAFRVA